MKPAAGLLAVGVGIGLLLPGPPMLAQTVEGSVTDARTGDRLATTLVTLLGDDNEHVRSTLTDGEGAFRLGADSPGTYVLELQRLGYHPHRTVAFEVPSGGAVRQDVRLDPEAIAVEGVTVQLSTGQLLHEPTLSGVYARRARSPSVGANRVLVRGQDRELEGPQVIENVLPQRLRRVSPACARLRRNHPVILLNGWEAELQGWSPTELLKAFPVREVEAIEYYQDLSAVPTSLRPVENDRAAFDFTIVRACGLLAIWTRGAPR